MLRAVLSIGVDGNGGCSVAAQLIVKLLRRGAARTRTDQLTHTHGSLSRDGGTARRAFRANWTLQRNVKKQARAVHKHRYKGN